MPKGQSIDDGQMLITLREVCGVIGVSDGDPAAVRAGLRLPKRLVFPEIPARTGYQRRWK